MVIQESGEMYLETILLLSQKKGNVRSVDLVNEMGYTKSSVSKGVKNLREMGYIYLDENEFIHFTAIGKEKAESTYERHCVLTKIFVWLGVSEKTAEDDACRIEHVISDETFRKLKEKAAKIL